MKTDGYIVTVIFSAVVQRNHRGLAQEYLTIAPENQLIFCFPPHFLYNILAKVGSKRVTHITYYTQ